MNFGFRVPHPSPLRNCDCMGALLFRATNSSWAVFKEVAVGDSLRSEGLQLNIQAGNFVVVRGSLERAYRANKMQHGRNATRLTQNRGACTWLKQRTCIASVVNLTDGAMTMLGVDLISRLQTPRVQGELFREGRNFFANALFDYSVS
jgi:hypothetical protein